VFGNCKAQNRLGLPNVYGWDSVSDNERLLPNVMRSMNVKPSVSPEQRWLARTWYEAECESLSNARTPYDLIQAVLHTAVGQSF
jgi:hypothetical protein